MPQSYYDGHESVVGVNGNNPTIIPRTEFQIAGNRQFRWGENRTRPQIRHVPLTFLDDDRNENMRKLFETGNVQGATFYNSYPSFLSPYLVVSIAGTIFTIEMRGGQGYVRKLFEGNFPTLLHAWFGQGFEWLVIQDGASKPILWNGDTAARRSVGAEVPTGSVMAFIHGRLCVCSSDGSNQIAVGDIVYGSDATNTNDIIRFTETTYWSEGGAFGAPLFIGDVQFMAPMPYLDTGTGQNELVIVGTEGGCSLDLSGPRESWKDSSVLRVSQLGGGGISSHGYCLLNGDLIFRGVQGVRSYRNARSEFQQTWNSTPISSDVRRYLPMNGGPYGQFCSMVSWNNQVLVSVSPQIAKPNNPDCGFHRYHRGLVVLDASLESNTGQRGASTWQGLWTGIRPTVLVEGRINDIHRCFAFSYDRDGTNRLYEFTNNEDEDSFNGEPVKIQSFYDTGMWGNVAQISSNFDLKELEGAAIELSHLGTTVNTRVSYRPDSFQCFLPMGEFISGCDCPPPPECALSSGLLSDIRYIGGAKQDAIPGTCIPGNKLHHTQARVEMVGRANVDRLRFKFTPQPLVETVNCKPQKCFAFDCCPYDHEFAYSIAPADPVNTTSVLPAPPDDPAACQPQNVVAFQTQPNSFTEMSEQFTVGKYAPSVYEGRKWRLYEAFTDTSYANGTINAVGQLVVTTHIPAGEVFFNLQDLRLVNTLSDRVVKTQLQVACGNDWPVA